jgi:hypothetical protein
LGVGEGRGADLRMMAQAGQQHVLPSLTKCLWYQE